MKSSDIIIPDYLKKKRKKKVRNETQKHPEQSSPVVQQVKVPVLLLSDSVLAWEFPCARDAAKTKNKKQKTKNCPKQDHIVCGTQVLWHPAHCSIYYGKLNEEGTLEIRWLTLSACHTSLYKIKSGWISLMMENHLIKEAHSYVFDFSPNLYAKLNTVSQKLVRKWPGVPFVTRQVKNPTSRNCLCGSALNEPL